MLPDSKIKCPATAFKRTCRSIVLECDCPKFVNIKMRNPQTGEMVDKFGCVDGFLPLLLIENSQQTRQAGASIDQLRSDVAAANTERMNLVQSVVAVPYAARIAGK